MQITAHVTIVGDNEIAREGLKRLLEEGGFKTTCLSVSEIPQRIAEMVDGPDHIILIDAETSDGAIKVCQLVRSHLASVRVAVLSAVHDVASVRDALASGVDGYLARQTSCVPLLLMLELIAVGEKVLPRKFIDDFTVNGHAAPTRPLGVIEGGHNLSVRELGIMRFLVDGDPNKIIARKLGITEATVKIHVKGILRKLQVINRTQAAIWVVSRGIFLDVPVEVPERVPNGEY